MQVRNNKHKNYHWLEEISLPIQQIRQTGGVFVITIPQATIKKYNLEKGTKVHPILLRRKRRQFGELKEGEEWVKMDKIDRIKFEQWCRREEKIEEISDLL